MMGAAHATEVPNMLGNWKPDRGDRLRATGPSGQRLSSGTTPSYNLQPRPRVVIDSQQGRGLGGYEIFADGTKEPFVAW